LKRLIEHYGIPTDHLEAARVQRTPPARRPKPLHEILVKDSTYARGHLKERRYAEGVEQRYCELCGQGEHWRGRAMALILDHVNGVPTDNRIENLRTVCPNCAATLDTHCGRKNRRGKVPRPSHAQLRADVASMSLLAVGRKYGVSDNAVRKWLRAYERAGEGEAPGTAS
jgi:hypothetical protein